MFKLGLLSLSILASLSSQASTFGTAGSDGYSGNDGQSGRSGQDIVVWAQQNRPLSFNLDGEHGDSATPGVDGQDATSCYQPYTEYSVVGADGGDGGRGGDGGSGGSGGDATIYYSDLAQLRMIYISALGGQGGMGSYGGRGGYGCRCSVTSWSVPRCREVVEKDTGLVRTVCDGYDNYTCRDGDNGSHGRQGSDGSDGSRGRLTLIKSDSPLLAEQRGIRVDIQDLKSSPRLSFELSENIFVSRAGALGLLAPGSIVSDHYYEFSRRAEEVVNVVWAAKRTPAPFKGTVTASISNGKVSFSLSTQDILLTETQSQGNTHTLVIKEAMNLSEFSIFGITAEGRKRDLAIRITGKIVRPDLVKDTVHVKISRKRFLLGYKEVFSGYVPAQLLQYSGEDLIAKIGQLRFSEDDETFKSEVEVKVEVTATRSVVGSSNRIERKANLFKQQ